MVAGAADVVLAFLNRNSGGIAAVATTVGVLIAGLYTFYTTKLWRVSAAQARTAEQQARIARRQLRLMEQQAAANEAAFERLHRPYLLIDAQMEMFALGAGAEAETAFLTIAAKNYGGTAASIVSARCDVPRGEGAVWGHRFLPIVIPPGESEGLGRAVVQSRPEADVPWTMEEVHRWMRWFHVEVRYIGPAKTEYCAKARITLMAGIKDKTRWTVQSVTPTGPEFPEVDQGIIGLPSSHTLDARPEDDSTDKST